MKKELMLKRQSGMRKLLENETTVSEYKTTTCTALGFATHNSGKWVCTASLKKDMHLGHDQRKSSSAEESNMSYIIELAWTDTTWFEETLIRMSKLSGTLYQSVQLMSICSEQQLFRRARKARGKSTSILCILLYKASSGLLWIKPCHKTSFGLLTVSQEPTSSACCMKKCKWNIIQTRKTQFEENVDSTEHITTGCSQHYLEQHSRHRHSAK